MNRRSLSFALVVVLIIGRSSSVRGQPQDATESVPQSSAADIVIDLASIKPGTPASVPPPAGPGPLRLALRNRVPTAHYVLRVEGLVLQPPPISLAAIAETRSATLGPECQAIESAHRILLRTHEEAELPVQRGVLESQLAARPCPLAERRARETLDRANPVVAQLELRPGESMTVSIERLARVSGPAIKRWQVNVGPPVDWAAVQSQLQKTLPGAPPSQWSYRDEGEWLTAAIIREIAAALQRARSTTGDPVVRFPEVRTPPQKIRLMLGSETVLVDPPNAGEHAWSPGAFVSVASALMSRFELKPAQASPRTASALGPLLDPRPAVLLAENQRISRWLEKEPLAAEAHEQAALLLGAFGLREAAGIWSDTRAAMCAITAHLALAQVLRQGRPPSADGTYAALVLETLAGRERPTLTALPALRSTAAPRAWLDALTLRNSRDWRTLKDPKAAVLLARLEHYRALTRSRGPLHALEFLAERRPEPLPEWGLVGVYPRLPVEVGNTFASSLLPDVQDQVAEVWKATAGKDLPTAEPLSVLNEKPRDDGRDVLGWTLWAGFFERHILHAAQATLHYYSQVVGLPDQAQVFRVWAAKELTPLARFALFDAFWRVAYDTPGRSVVSPGASPTEQEEACGRAVPLLRSRPEIVPAEVWDLLDQKCWRQKSRGELPPLSKWLPLVVPRGTAYDAKSRLRIGALYATIGSQEAQAIHALIVCDATIESAYALARSRRLLTAAEFREGCGAALEYNTIALGALVQMEDNEKSTELASRRRLCDLEPDECIPLGARLAALRLDDEAAAAFQKAVDRARDRVGVSNEVSILVDYEFDHGHAEKAEMLAQMAAQTFSYVGLETLGRLRERMGRYDEAKAVYEQIARRYDSNGLDAFYVRYSKRRSDDRYVPEAAAATKRLFPDGLQMVMLLDFKLLPGGTLLEAGYMVTSNQMHPELERYGVQPGDFILAVDGYRVRNWNQYRCARSFTDAQPMKLIVWRQSTVQELEGTYRRPRFGPRIAP